MSTKHKEDRYEVDPFDSLRTEPVGNWVHDKHLRLRHYIDISRAARRKFRGNSTFIDLYCGPGRSRIKGTNSFHPGSAIAGAQEAANKVPFGDIHIADLDEVNVDHCLRRFEREQLGPVRSYIGRAEDTSKEIASRLSRSGLHFAFLDPYNVQSLPFSVIENLATLERMDMLIHVSTMDLQRNVKRLMKNGDLDLFAPGWRENVDPALRNDIALISVFHHWCNLIQGLGYKDVRHHVEKVRGDKNQPLYWLVLASRSDVGNEFWAKVRNVTPQQRLL